MGVFGGTNCDPRSSSWEACQNASEPPGEMKDERNMMEVLYDGVLLTGDAGYVFQYVFIYIYIP